MKRILRVAAIGLLIWTGAAHAVLTIKITRGVEGALPVAIVPFGWDGPGGAPEDIAAIVTSDLQRSGQFEPLPVDAMPARPHAGTEILFRDWRLIGAEFIVVGRVVPRPDGGHDVRFQLFDVYKGVQIAGYSIPADAETLRGAAHRISDIVFERLTGKRGAFSTRIAYVTILDNADDTRFYTLQIADSDGRNHQTVVESDEPLLSPAWSPDGKRLAYVSFEDGSSGVYVQDIATGRRERVSRRGEMSSAPAWSPDGRRLALTISRDGNADIHVLDLETRKLTRLTRNPAIDTEPAWSPDGGHLVFTSDRGGRPQIYRIGAHGGRATRITFEGGYNARARFSPDGRSLALVHGSDGRYRIAVYDFETGLLRRLTDGVLDESPSFAPNGQMILYATTGSEGAELAAVSVDGRVRQRLILAHGDVREPGWSPFGD